MEMLSVITFQLSFRIRCIELYLLRWDATGCGLKGRISIPDKGKRFVFTSQRPNPLWGPYNGYRGSFPGSKAAAARS
jgi:hypothetical protein